MLVFWFWWEIVLMLHMYLMYNTVVPLCQFFGCGGKMFSKWEQLLISYEQFLKKISYWVALLWSASWCVYFVRSNTLLLCIFLSYIFCFYRTDLQAEVQIRMLLKDKYAKSCQNANTGNHTMISCTQFLRKILLWFIYFTETTPQPRYVSHMIQTFCYCISLYCIVWIYNLTVTIVSQKYQELLVQVEISE